METKEIALRQQLPASSMMELVKAGELLAQSGMFGIQNAAAGFVVMATCHQQGISLMEFMRTYHIVENKPSMRADAMLAEFRKLGGRYKIIENSTERAAAEFTFEKTVISFEYTMDEAKRIGDCLKRDGKIKEIWQKRPEDMLWARMVSRAVRRLAPEINAGVYSPEEVVDFDDKKGNKPLTQDEVLRRAKVIKSEPAIDYSVCPIGGEDVEGRAWETFTFEELHAALCCDDPAITDLHKEAIQMVINKGEA
jgi:hypothetical protein